MGSLKAELQLRAVCLRLSVIGCYDGVVMTHPAAIPVDELLKECDVRFVRRSGPGGQRRNKVETGVHIRHRPTELQAEAAERRSQEQNRKAAVHRLRLTLAREVRRPVAEQTPSALWTSRCRGRRISVNAGHADFPALLAEALDVLAECGYELRPAAERLQVSSSQLTKLLKQDAAAFGGVNDQRESLGLPRLR